MHGATIKISVVYFKSHHLFMKSNRCYDTMKFKDIFQFYKFPRHKTKFLYAHRIGVFRLFSCLPAACAF